MLAIFYKKVDTDFGIYYNHIATAELSKKLIELYQYETTESGETIHTDLLIGVGDKLYTPKEALELLKKE